MRTKSVHESLYLFRKLYLIKVHEFEVNIRLLTALACASSFNMTILIRDVSTK